MLLDLVLVGILLLMVGFGAWRGAVVSGSGLAGLIFGYAGGILGAMKLAGWVEEALVVSPLIAPAVAGTIGFVAAWLVVSSLCDVLVAWDQARADFEGRGIVDRALGATFGLARGSLIVVLLSVLMTWLDAARDLGAVEGLAALPQSENSAVADATGTIVEAAVSTALSGSGAAGDVAARITARPGRALESVQLILNDERLNQLFEDKLFWTAIQSESIDYAMNRSAIRSMVRDPEMRGRFVDLGLVGEAAREDQDVFRNAMASVLAEIAPKIAGLHRDPEIQALASDPEIIRLVQSGDTFALMSHPRLKRIVNRVSKDL